MSGQSLISSDNYSFSNASAYTTNAYNFLEKTGLGKLKCHGRVTEVNHQDLFYSKFHKFINSIFRGEAYQFGHQTSEYLIRVEELDSTYSMQSVDFFLYGNYMGRIQPGDEIEIFATERGNRRIANSIHNISTDSWIHPGIQLSASVIRVIFILLTILTIFLISNLVGYLSTDEGTNLIIKILILIGGGLVIRGWIKRKFFRRK